MENTKNITTKPALSLGTMGFITFIVLMILKLTGPLTSLSWFWVTFPLWIPWALSLFIFIIVIIVCFIVALKDSR